MAGVLQDLTPREEGIAAVSRALAFPWAFGERTLPFEEAAGRRIMRAIIAPEDFPPYDRSTRDGYAVRSVDSHGATPANPVFLREAGEVVMGRLPTFALGSTECALIHTGGILPSGADAVVMTEDAEATKGWLEIRRAVQRMENVLSAGEEFRAGDVLLPAGRRLDFRTLGLLAMAGIGSVPLPDITVGIVSTGDEIVPAGTARLRPGQFRDVNSVLLASSLREEGYTSRFFGIAGDDRESLRSVLFRAMDECDVVLVSGGSSVSMRDHSSSIMEELPAPGLLVRGILMSPGKPTLIAGMARERKLLFGLPGHPFSCFVSWYAVALPLLNAMIWGSAEGTWTSVHLPAAETIFAQAGVEEFTPGRIEKGRVVPLPVKSGFAGALTHAHGLCRLPASQETVRAGEEVELWLW